MSGGGGGGGTSTSTVITVPDWARPYVSQYAQQALNLWQTDAISTYTGPIVASQNVDELAGIDGLANRGRYGDQVITKAISHLGKIINGELLLGASAEFQTALASVLTKSEDGFNTGVYTRIGRKPYYVGDPDSTFLAKTLSAGFPATRNARLSAALYMENFLKERTNQQHGLSFGVEMGKHAAIDAETLRRAGLFMREYLQESYAIQHKLFVEEQELEVARLEIFGNALRALTGSQQTTTQQMEGNKFMGAVGGVMAGAAFGYMITGGNPIGALVGGAIGGIIGLFS